MVPEDGGQNRVGGGLGLVKVGDDSLHGDVVAGSLLDDLEARGGGEGAAAVEGGLDVGVDPVSILEELDGGVVVGLAGALLASLAAKSDGVVLGLHGGVNDVLVEEGRDSLDGAGEGKRRANLVDGSVGTRLGGDQALLGESGGAGDLAVILEGAHRRPDGSVGSLQHILGLAVAEEVVRVGNHLGVEVVREHVVAGCGTCLDVRGDVVVEGETLSLVLVPVGARGEILVDEVGVAKSRLRVDDLEVLDDGVHVGLGGAGIERSKDILVHLGVGAPNHLAKVSAALVRTGVDGVAASSGGAKVLGRRGVPVGLLLVTSFAVFGVTGVLKVGDNGLHRDAVHDGLLDGLSLGSGGGVGGGGGSRVGDDGGHPVGAAVVSGEHGGSVLAAPLREALEAGRLKRLRDVGAGASVDEVDNLLDSLRVGEGGANVVVGGLDVRYQGVGAGVGGDGGDDAVGDVAGASHAGGLIEVAEGGGRSAGGGHGAG